MAFDTLATRKGAKARILMTGTSGSGKTFTALMMAGLMGCQKIGVGDSEAESANKYVGEPEIPPFHAERLVEKSPQELLEKLADAANAGVDCFIADSYSHNWLTALEIVDQAGGNKFTNGWKAMTPVLRRVTEALQNYPGHIICTARENDDYALETDAKSGKVIPRKVGMAPVLRKGTEYEFDVVFSLDTSGRISLVKTRARVLRQMFDKAGGNLTWADVPRITAALVKWLAEGSPASPGDVLGRRIRFAADGATLAGMSADVKAHLAAHPEDTVSLREAFRARKTELLGSGGVTA